MVLSAVGTDFRNLTVGFGGDFGNFRFGFRLFDGNILFIFRLQQSLFLLDDGLLFLLFGDLLCLYRIGKCVGKVHVLYCRGADLYVVLAEILRKHFLDTYRQLFTRLYQLFRRVLRSNHLDSLLDGRLDNDGVVLATDVLVDLFGVVFVDLVIEGVGHLDFLNVATETPHIDGDFLHAVVHCNHRFPRRLEVETRLVLFVFHATEHRHDTRVSRFHRACATQKYAHYRQHDTDGHRPLSNGFYRRVIVVAHCKVSDQRHRNDYYCQNQSCHIFLLTTAVLSAVLYKSIILYFAVLCNMFRYYRLLISFLQFIYVPKNHIRIYFLPTCTLVALPFA